MDKKICVCVIGSEYLRDETVIKMIHAYGKAHQLPEIQVISAEEFKKSEFNKNREQIKMHTELILKSVIQGIESKEIIEQDPEEIKYKKQQDKFRERNYKPNLKYGRYGR